MVICMKITSVLMKYNTLSFSYNSVVRSFSHDIGEELIKCSDPSVSIMSKFCICTVSGNRRRFDFILQF